MNIKKLSLGAVLVTLLMTLLSLVSPTSSVKAETKKYVIATDITFAPFEYQDTNGEYVGIDIELMKSIAEAEGFEVEFKPLATFFASILLSLLIFHCLYDIHLIFLKQSFCFLCRNMMYLRDNSDF